MEVGRFYWRGVFDEHADAAIVVDYFACIQRRREFSYNELVNFRMGLQERTLCNVEGDHWSINNFGVERHVGSCLLGRVPSIEYDKTVVVKRVSNDQRWHSTGWTGRKAGSAWSPLLDKEGHHDCQSSLSEMDFDETIRRFRDGVRLSIG